MSQQLRRDLDALGTNAFRVEHLASDAIAVAADEVVFETLAWMDANDFDQVPLLDAWPPRVVDRAHLRSAPANAAVGTLAVEVPEDRLAPRTLGLRDAIERLQRHGSVLVCDDGVVVGIVTRHDLNRPAANLYVFALTTAVEHGLRRLLGTYSSRPITDWAAPLEDGEASTGVDRASGEPKTFSGVLNAAASWTGGALPSSLGYASNTAFSKATKRILRLRNHLAHGRSILHECDATDAPAVIGQLWDMVDRVWRHVEDRDQVWDAFRDTRVVDRDARALDERARATQDETACHVITACNPFEEVLTPAVNARRSEALAALLRHRGVPFDEVDGVSPVGDWREQSFLVHGLDRASACAIGKRFGQRAVFEIEGGQIRVVRVDGAIMRHRAFPKVIQMS